MNIVLILSDDQTYNTVHALGNTHIITPNLDELVAKGTSFTHAHIMGGRQGAICAPSRAMVLTGTYANHLTQDGYVIQESTPTLPEILRANGYTTFATGKWHSDKQSFNRAFSGGDNIFFGGMHELKTGGHFAPKLNHYDSTAAYPDIKAWKGDHFSSEYFCEAAVKFIEQQRDATKPFFLYVPFTSPHDPRTPPAEFEAMYDAGNIPLPAAYKPVPEFDNGELKIRDEMLLPHPRDSNLVKKEIASYYAMITEMDKRIGAIIAALKAAGVYDNTLIVFAGDNGLALGNHGLLGKQNLYDHSVRVPLIIAGPGIPANKQSHQLVYTADITPTVLAYASIPRTPSIQSENLQRIISGAQGKPRSAVYYLYRDLQRGVRTADNWKLIAYKVSATPFYELFDLNKDPYELRNLAADKRYKKQLAKLKKTLSAQMLQLEDDLNPELFVGKNDR